MRTSIQERHAVVVLVVQETHQLLGLQNAEAQAAGALPGAGPRARTGLRDPASPSDCVVRLLAGLAVGQLESRQVLADVAHRFVTAVRLPPSADARRTSAAAAGRRGLPGRSPWPRSEPRRPRPPPRSRAISSAALPVEPSLAGQQPDARQPHRFVAIECRRQGVRRAGGWRTREGRENRRDRELRWRTVVSSSNNLIAARAARSYSSSRCGVTER